MYVLSTSYYTSMFVQIFSGTNFKFLHIILPIFFLHFSISKGKKLHTFSSYTKHFIRNDSLNFGTLKTQTVQSYFP